MQFANAEEFWAALGRLYDSTLELRENIQRLDEKTERLADGSQRLLQATETLYKVVESHERRLDRTEVTVEAILEDLRRSRGQQL